jgi:hypothetical protein
MLPPPCTLQYPDPLTDAQVNGATATFDVTLNGDDASWTLDISGEGPASSLPPSRAV